MNVKELIEELQQLPEDAEVLVLNDNGYWGTVKDMTAWFNGDIKLHSEY
jgi:hypothetical protein